MCINRFGLKVTIVFVHTIIYTCAYNMFMYIVCYVHIVSCVSIEYILH